jgi:uncharacterized protein YhaN
MKIRWVEATNFRKFVGTVRIEGIGDGINVLDGHNEIGKSTLMEAINGVVFERQRHRPKKPEVSVTSLTGPSPKCRSVLTSATIAGL